MTRRSLFKSLITAPLAALGVKAAKSAQPRRTTTAPAPPRRGSYDDLLMADVVFAYCGGMIYTIKNRYGDTHHGPLPGRPERVVAIRRYPRFEMVEIPASHVY